VTAGNPDPYYSREVRVHVDGTGRLVLLEGVPPERAESTDTAAPPDWGALFAAAGLSQKDYRPAGPQWSPPWFADRRAAWERGDAAREEIPARVEAAAFGGRPVYFAMIDPWDRADRMVPPDPVRGQFASLGAFVLVFSSIIGGSIFLARRNLRLGRGDRRGALRLALYMVAVSSATELLLATHALDLGMEFTRMIELLRNATIIGCLTWLGYIALEPILRRRWPDAMISWNRLLEGRWRDPRIGRDLVAGAAAAGAMILLFDVAQPMAIRLAGVAPSLRLTNTLTLEGTTGVLSRVGYALLTTLMVPMCLLFLVLLLRMALRVHLLAAGVSVLLLTIPELYASPLPALTFCTESLFWILLLVLLTRFGLVSGMAFYFYFELVHQIPSPDFSAWYAGGTVLLLVVMAAVAGFGLATSVSGGPARAGVVGHRVLASRGT